MCKAWVIKFAFLFAATSLFVGEPASAAKSKLQKEIDTCMKNWLPPQTDDKDRKWFNPNVRCEASKAVPNLDEARCEKIVDQLATLSAELNRSVEEACNTYIPELVADGCKQESKDPHCIGKMNELLARASENSDNFDKNLDKYIRRLKQLRKFSLEGAMKVYEATAYSENRKKAVEAANRYFQNLTGDKTADDFVKRNRNQPSGPLKELIADFEKHNPSDISGTELGSAAGRSAIAKRAAGLDKAWRTLDQKVPSPLAYEQLVNTLDAEETHLKMMQYKDDLARMKKEITSMRATNDKTLKELKSMGSVESEQSASTSAQGANVGGGATGGPNGAGPSAAPGLTGSPAVAATESGSSPFSFTPVRVRGTETAAAERMSIEAKSSTNTAEADAAKGNRAGASRYRGSLRDALRNKLAQDLPSGNSERGPTAATENAGTMEKGTSVYGRPSGRALASVASEANAFAQSEGALSEGGFSLGGADHDEFVNGILSDFEDAIKHEQSAPASAYIGGLDSSPLFERVKIYHDRCLREGRVGTKE